MEEDKDIFPQRPYKTKPIGESIRNSSGDKSPTGPARFSSTDTDKRPKTKTWSSGQDPTHDPTDQNGFALSDQSTTPEDLKRDQGKKLLLGPEAQTTQMTYKAMG